MEKEKTFSEVRDSFIQFESLYRTVENKDNWSKEENVRYRLVADYYLTKHFDPVVRGETNLCEMAEEMIESVEFWKHRTLLQDKKAQKDYLVSDYFPDFDVKDLYIWAAVSYKEARCEMDKKVPYSTEYKKYFSQANQYKRYELIAATALQILQKRTSGG